MPTSSFQQQAPPAAPPAPPAPTPRPSTDVSDGPAVVGATTGQATIAIPMTGQEIRALRARRSELSNQLTSATSRRDELAEQLRGMDEAGRPGIVDRMTLLDKRILNLEAQLDQTGQQLAAASPAVLAQATISTPIGERVDSDAVTAIGVTVTMFVLGPIALAASRLLWKRGSVPTRAPTLSAEGSQRLDRIENAVDAIAIEVERVSEGQRFLTRLFTEAKESPVAAALGVGERPAQPIPVGESVGQGRGR